MLSQLSKYLDSTSQRLNTEEYTEKTTVLLGLFCLVSFLFVCIFSLISLGTCSPPAWIPDCTYKQVQASCLVSQFNSTNKNTYIMNYLHAQFLSTFSMPVSLYHKLIIVIYIVNHSILTLRTEIRVIVMRHVSCIDMYSDTCSDTCKNQKKVNINF